MYVIAAKADTPISKRLLKFKEKIKEGNHDETELIAEFTNIANTITEETRSILEFGLTQYASIMIPPVIAQQMIKRDKIVLGKYTGEALVGNSIHDFMDSVWLGWMPDLGVSDGLKKVVKFVTSYTIAIAASLSLASLFKHLKNRRRRSVMLARYVSVFLLFKIARLKKLDRYKILATLVRTRLMEITKDTHDVAVNYGKTTLLAQEMTLLTEIFDKIAKSASQWPIPFSGSFKTAIELLYNDDE